MGTNADILAAAGAAFGVAGASSPSDLSTAVGLPGVIYRFQVVNADDTLPDGSADFMASMGALWEKFAGSGIYSAGEINRARAVLDRGLLVYPASALAVQNTDPARPPELVEPVLDTIEKRQAWAQMLEAFRLTVGSYLRGQVAEAAAEGRRLAAVAYFWEVAETVTGAVAAIPDVVAGGILSTLISPRIVALVVVVAVGYIAWTQRDTLAKAAARKVAG